MGYTFEKIQKTYKEKIQKKDMLKRNHFTWTFFISLYIYFLFFEYSPENTLILAFFTASISWLPDIDFKILDVLRNFEAKTLYILTPLIAFLKFIFQHRGITHSIFIPVILLVFGEFVFTQSIIIQTILRVFYLALFLHIFEDSLTIRGIKPFFPFSNQAIQFKLINTSSATHFVILEIIAYAMSINFYVYYFL